MGVMLFGIIGLGIIGWYKWDTAWSPQASENRERIKAYAAEHCSPKAVAELDEWMDQRSRDLTDAMIGIGPDAILFEEIKL